MVKKCMNLHAMVFWIVLCTVLFTPVYADDMATIFNSQGNSFTLNGLVENTSTLLAPVMSMNNVTVVATSNKVINFYPKRLEERFVNLLSNALVHAPAGAVIKVSFENNQISLWVENSSINYSIKREVVDSQGNTFIIETVSGKGTLYAINL